MLRLGRKYQFKYLRKEAIHCLQREFPGTLALWDEREPNAHIAVEESFLFKVAYLAHENSIQSILPMIYLAIRDSYFTTGIKIGFSIRKTHSLRLNEPLSCIIAYEALLSQVPSTILPFLHDGKIPSTSCLNPTACDNARNKLLADLWRDGGDFAIEFVTQSWTKNKLQARFCTKCASYVKGQYNRGRQKVWEMLPVLFGIDKPDVPWDLECSDDENEEDNTGE
ncbi:unnamed protein product [Cyclocybe aegerita]|uniref:Uncharacterized protein n=1 Tax=Cyclocybe aegerita TaxID=1973307 RepID=A0A8S0WDM0_CYCAE|nr:unnamed protein product [Cyclocybe aegerita]